MDIIWTIYAPGVDLSDLARRADSDMTLKVRAVEEPLRGWVREDYGFDVDERLVALPDGPDFAADLARLVAIALRAGDGDVVLLGDQVELMRRRSGTLTFGDDAEYWRPLVTSALEERPRAA